jgi:hypothetical protein
VSIEFDASEVTQLAADLGKIPGRMVAPMVAAVTKSANSLEKAMRADAGGIGHAPHFPNSITSEVKVRVGQIEAEVGPDKGRTQGALGNILYFGTSKNGPVLNINGPLDAQSPKFQQAIEDAAGKLFDE